MEFLEPIFWCGAVIYGISGCWLAFVLFRFSRTLESCRSLESELGFRQGSIHVPGDKSEPYYKVVIRSVEKWGTFDLAGICAGDILPELKGCAVLDSPQTALSKLLICNRGSNVELAAINIADIVDDAVPFETLKRRTVAIAIPQKKRGWPFN